MTATKRWKRVVGKYVAGPAVRRIPGDARRVAAAERISHLPLSGKRLVRQHGSLMLLDLQNLIDRYAYLERGWENSSLKAFAQAAKDARAEVFVDIGAAAGTYTLAMAQVPSIDRIIAFEPDPRNRAQLQANLWLNDLSERVEIHPTAASEASGTASFYLARKPDYWEKSMTNFGTSALDFLPMRHEKAASIQVTTEALDDLALTQTRVALKIDVEGHEEQALLGSRETLKSASAVVLLIEIFDQNKESVQAILRDLNLTSHRQVGPENYLYFR